MTLNPREGVFLAIVYRVQSTLASHTFCSPRDCSESTQETYNMIVDVYVCVYMCLCVCLRVLLDIRSCVLVSSSVSPVRRAACAAVYRTRSPRAKLTRRKPRSSSNALRTAAKVSANISAIYTVHSGPSILRERRQTGEDFWSFSFLSFPSFPFSYPVVSNPFPFPFPFRSQIFLFPAGGSTNSAKGIGHHCKLPRQDSGRTATRPKPHFCDIL